MLKGLPASGKSTQARELVRQGYVRVNRDLLREMMHFSRFKDEDMVVDVEKFIVRGYLGKGKDVVVDDCNLNPANLEMWKEIARQYSAEFEIIYTNTPVDECILRDSVREKYVGSHVIKQMALQYNILNIEGQVVICDIDGTIADCSHRQHYVRQDKKDWVGFFSEMYRDTVRIDTLKFLQEYYQSGHKIIFVSARPEDYREITEGWLSDKVGIPYELLIMRRSGDKRDDTIVKSDIYKKYLKELDILTVIDDRPKVIRMWRDLGLNVIDVGDGIEF